MSYTVKGKVTSIDWKEGRNGRKYPAVSVSGKTYNVFKGLHGIANGDIVELELQENPQNPNWTDVLSIRKSSGPVGVPSPGGEGNGGSEPVREQRIGRMNAGSIAATLIQSVPYDIEHGLDHRFSLWKMLSHDIYNVTMFGYDDQKEQEAPQEASSPDTQVPTGEPNTRFIEVMGKQKERVGESRFKEVMDKYGFERLTQVTDKETQKKLFNDIKELPNEGDEF